jgi:regulator of sigma D
VTSPFTMIRDMASKLPDVTEQDLLLNVLTLDDWVHLYRLRTAADAVGAVEPKTLYSELSQHGLAQLCRSLADRMIERIFSVDPGAQLHSADEHRFNLMAHLEQGVIYSLTPDIVRA